MKRVLVLGGRGGFGRAIVEQFANLGVPSEVASRRAGSKLQVDANDPSSLRRSVHRGDLVIDAAGPFHVRSMALIEAAIEIGFEVVDINDDLSYAQRVLAAKERIDAAGIRVLSSASTVSAIAATAIRQAGLSAPVRISGIMAPATRSTANLGAARSLLRCVGQPIQVWRDGQWRAALGWSEPRPFQLPPPLGVMDGRLFESADALYLPQIWPSLGEVTTRVDANTLGVNALLRVAAAVPIVRRLLAAQLSLGTRLGKWLGRHAGGVGYEIEDRDGRIFRHAFVAAKNSFLVAVAPAVLAAVAIWRDRFPHQGLVLPDKHVEPAPLAAYLEQVGIVWVRDD